MPADNKRKKDAESSSSSAGRKVDLDSLATPLGLLSFTLLLDCLTIFPHAFPLRTEVIAGILNKCLPPHEQIDRFAVFNVISKIRNNNSTVNEIQASTCINRPDVVELARKNDSFFVAFPRATACLLCKAPLTWMDTSQPRRPHFFPNGARPGKGIVQAKYCKSCSSLYSVGYYRPENAEAKRPYPDHCDHQVRLQLSEETLVSKDLLRRHDNNL
jgi:hypothetical protein